MPARIPPVQFVSVFDAAQVLRVNINTLYEALRANEVPHIRVGPEYRIPLEFFGITPEPVEVPDRNGRVIGQLFLDLRY